MGNINKLKINSDKTQLMLPSKPAQHNFTSNFQFRANTHITQNKTYIKILGITIRHNLDMNTQVGNLCSNLSNRLYNIKKISKFTNFTTRLQFVKSLVIGKFIYCLPLFTQTSKSQQSKLHKIIMMSARTIIGNYCYKKSIGYILGKYN